VEPLRVTLEDVRAAEPVVQEVAVRTPTVRYFGAPKDVLWLKLENLQRLGSFKIRGVWNGLRRMDPTARSRGVATFSSGNFGLAFAWAGTRLGLHSRVIVSESANPTMVARIRDEGAIVETMSAAQIFAILEDESWRSWETAFLNPVGDPHVIAGEGTIALEFVQDVPELRTVLVPVGGGDLAAGLAAAVKGLCPTAKIVGVQAEGAAPLPTALHTGRRHQIEGPARTIAVGISMTVILDEMAVFLARHLDGCLLVSDDDIRRGVRDLARDARVVAEPSGAAAFAAWSKYGDRLESPVVAVISGGNVDPAFLSDVLR